MYSYKCMVIGLKPISLYAPERHILTFLALIYSLQTRCSYRHPLTVARRALLWLGRYVKQDIARMHIRPDKCQNFSHG